MTISFFVAGTDTNIGKTTATIGLINQLQNKNNTVIGLKPVATGCFLKNKKLFNHDALLLQAASDLKPEYKDINFFRYQLPVSPHIVNQDIRVNNIISACKKSIDKYHPDFCLIEGAGGWFCPLNQQETFADLAGALELPVILVVGIKLGCLNHAKLTFNAILQQKLKVHGWIANCLEENMLSLPENITYLQNNISAPLLGIINLVKNYPQDIKLNINEELFR